MPSVAAARALNEHLSPSTDPELFNILELEKQRQRNSLVLIASENYAPARVLDALGTVMSNKYSEGYPNARYYGGNQFVDKCELLCQKRALAAFGLSDKEWAVNVQSLSGTPANFQVYAGLLNPHDRIMGLDLPHGGHLSHGFYSPKKKISATSLFFESLPYQVDVKTGLIDYAKLERLALMFRPKLIVAGTSAYSRLIDYAKFRQVCDQTGAILMCDIAHISGLVAAGVIPSAFEHADVVTTTTHKSLRGPRGAMIFSRKFHRVTKDKLDYPERIDFSVFPGLQGGPHNHTIAALAGALKLCVEPEYKAYQTQVLANAKRLCGKLQELGYDVVSGGTDTHLMLVNVKPHGLDGSRLETVLELCSIVSNKNTVPGDVSALVPGGIRFGTPAFTSRGATEEDFDQVAVFFHRAVQLAKALPKMAKVAEFKHSLKTKDEDEFKQRFPELAQLRREVEDFCSTFPTVGFKETEMVFPGRFN